MPSEPPAPGKVEIRRRVTGEIICSGKTLIEAVLANKAYLTGAYLRGANLRVADLEGADLRGADLTGADLRGADLTGAYLTGAYLTGADLTGADLRYAYLTGAYLRGAYLRSANLESANLESANLESANLESADLESANLESADLRGADLRGARLAWQSHDLISEILKRAAGDDIAKLKVAGLLLVCRDKCWGEFLAMHDPLADWVLDTLAEWVQPHDDAPECVRLRAKKAEEIN